MELRLLDRSVSWGDAVNIVSSDWVTKSRGSAGSISLDTAAQRECVL
jgi:hypothetical protein